jgi:hypothetical protein
MMSHLDFYQVQFDLNGLSTMLVQFLQQTINKRTLFLKDNVSISTSFEALADVGRLLAISLPRLSPLKLERGDGISDGF